MPRAIAVPPWLYGVAIREHGPDDSTMKLVLHTARTFMDDDGYCFPSIRAIAKAASLNKSTVTTKVDEARKLGFLAVYPGSGRGKQWKGNAYRACVPVNSKTAPLLAKHQALIDAHIAKVGDVDEVVEEGKVYGQPVQHETTGTAKVSGNAPKVSGLTDEGVRPDSTKVYGQPVPKFSSEVLIPSSHTEGPLARTVCVQEHGEQNKSQEPKPTAGPERFGQTGVAREALRGKRSGVDDEADRLRRIKVLLRQDPSLQTDWDAAARVMQCGRDLIGKAVTEIYAERTTTVEEHPV